MALKQLSFEHFKGATASFDLGHKNILKGFSGSGKTRIKDALSFVFCGTDSNGTRNPTHLITIGEDKLSVAVVTDKATITRTLTRKGNGTLKVHNGTIETSYTQTQFEKMIGSPDLFLSAMIPGYLFQLSQAKRMEVLTEVLPKIDRNTLVTELLGFEMTNEEKLKYGVSRRADLVASSIAVDRRQYELAITEKTGRINQLAELRAPVYPEGGYEADEAARFDGIKQAWSIYENELKAYNNRNASIAQVEKENKYREERRISLKDELSKIRILDLKSFKPNDADLISIRAELKPEPQEPLFVNEVLSEHCSTCGQIVAPRYRDQVKSANDKKRMEYMDELEAVRLHNNEVQSRLKIANDAFKKSENDYIDMTEANRKAQARAHAINLELAGLVDQVVPVALPEPVQPDLLYDKEAHLKLIEQNNNFNRALGAYNVKLEEFKTSATRIEVLQNDIATLSSMLERYKRMEDVFKKLPEVETSKSIGIFNTDILLFNGENVIVNGMPLKMLSTGEQMSVYMYFCYEINSRMPRPHNIIFVDDADLISSEAWSKVSSKSYDTSGFQYFLAHVVEGQEMQIQTQSH